jgi:hypothetical protein
VIVGLRRDREGTQLPPKAESQFVLEREPW